ncbi:sigma-70 family RNA polymerase sigma factor [Lysinibacillus sp. 54212]|uniref:sigma-70 family RNA polymerase sigma factor n=1 Tax=Lysinibacillus sp. 54212 TaxID=3119829 RepID=UPI002FC69D45
MDSFEEVYIKMEPIIRKLIFKCRVYKNFDEFKQVAIIALWRAWQSFDHSKCEFEPYAYWQMRYAILDELKKRNRDSTRLVSTEDEKLNFYIEQAEEKHSVLNMDERIEVLLNHCSQHERGLLYALFIEQKTNKEIALELGLSVEAIKKRRQRLINKLKNK